jgi:hypothetical protein
MSVTISNCTEICNSPTNLSKAKMLYSFPKASRFNDRKTALYFQIYLDAINSMRSAKMEKKELLVLAMEINMISLLSKFLLIKSTSFTPSKQI